MRQFGEPQDEPVVERPGAYAVLVDTVAPAAREGQGCRGDEPHGAEIGVRVDISSDSVVTSNRYILSAETFAK